MKKIFIIIMCIICIPFNTYASGLNEKEASEILIPFEDDHIMTREETMIVLSKIVGINDYAMSLHMTVKKFDYEPFEDIDYNSYKGRLLDLAINIYGENSYPTRKLFYFNNTNFYGEDHVSGADVLSWMLNILYFEDYKHTSEENFKERAIKVGLIEPTEYIRREITAKDLKKFVERFLNCTVYIYLEPPETIVTNYNKDPDLKYIDIFNKTYKDKNIYIKDDGIYLENQKISIEGEQPIIDENGVYYMPIRWFANFFGFDTVEWYENEQIAILKDYEPLKKINEEDRFLLQFTNKVTEYYCGNTKKILEYYQECANNKLNTEPKIIDDNLYIPLRDTFENMVYNVIWCK